MKPNLFIVGAPKCGTTFMYEKLKDHPDIFFSKIKELNYFSYQELAQKSYYRDFKLSSEEKYLSFFKPSKSEKFRVDASVSYFTFDNVPKQIEAFNSEAKIIMLVRDPYKRAYSHYLMDKRMGYAKESFSFYLKNKESFHFRQYVENSLYHKQYQKYQEVFGVENILVLQLEHIEQQFKKVYSFLEIHPVEVNFNDRINENKVSKNFIGNFAQKNRGLVERIKLIIPINIAKKAKEFIYTKGHKESILEKDLITLQSLIKSDYSQFLKIVQNES